GPAMRILLDTNIIVDNFARRDTYGESLQILDACENGKIESLVTTVTIMDVMYLLRKHLSSAEMRNAVQLLLQIVDIIPALKSDITAALSGSFGDVEDAVQASCAARAKADYIVTRNVKDFKHSPVPAVLPGDMLELLQNVN
ncbi:MAG: PIN domain-containing protein, partial [Peptococcaceae bacterium]|nr:PIN domain-containing protein [Peptococcaceae bacterium]